jgi:hypothetical protein
LRFFQLRPAAISRVAAAATSRRKLASISIATHQPVAAEKVTARRPAIHMTTSVASGVPCSGSRPVQFGIAVNRKPVMTAGR